MNTCKQSTRYSPTVRYLQMKLNQLSYICDVDGLLWNQTVAQLKRFQSDWGLAVDGNCNANTWSAIMDALNKKQPSVSPVEPVITETPTVQHYKGIVKTNHDGYISLWKTTLKTGRVCKVKDGEYVEITSDCISGTLAPAKFGDFNGYADTKYIVNRANL